MTSVNNLGSEHHLYGIRTPPLWDQNTTFMGSGCYSACPVYGGDAVYGGITASGRDHGRVYGRVCSKGRGVEMLVFFSLR